MTNYVELTNQLEEKDKNIITKLAIFHELSSLTGLEELPTEDINKLVEHIHEFYLNRNNADFCYAEIAGNILSEYNNNLDELLLSIEEEKKEKTNLKAMSLS